MRTNEVTQIKYIPPERIRAAMRQADRAFWAAIGEAFPEVTSRNVRTEDVSGWETGWETGRNWAVCVWLYHNAPPHDPGKHLQLAPTDIAQHLLHDHEDDLTQWFIEGRGLDFAAIEREIDPASYLAEHGIVSTGDHDLDVMLAWHHNVHPEQSSPAAQTATSDSNRHATHLTIVVNTDRPLANQVVARHAKQLAEDLAHGDDVAVCLNVTDGHGSKVTNWRGQVPRVHLGADDLAFLREGDTIHMPYVARAGEVMLSGEDDFTAEQLAQLAAGAEVLVTVDGDALWVTADPPLSPVPVVAASPATEGVTVEELRVGDRVASTGAYTLQTQGPGSPPEERPGAEQSTPDA